MKPTATRFLAFRRAARRPEHPRTMDYTQAIIMFDLHLNQKDREAVVVELWEFPPHARDGKSEHFLTQPVESARKVTLPVGQILRKQRRRGPFSGDKWTRTFVTVPRALANRWGLTPVADHDLPPAA